MITDILSTPRLGDILVAQGALTRAMLEEAARTVRGRIGQHLCAQNLISHRTLARALATQHALPFVDFTHAPPDPTLFIPRDLAHYTTHHYIPYTRTAGSLTIATSAPSPELQQTLSEYYNTPITLTVTGPRDLRDYFASRAATTATRRARLSLRRRYPHLTADRTLLPHQQRGLLIFFSLITTILILAPRSSWETLLVLCNGFYLLSLYMKLKLFRQGYAQHCSQIASLETLRTAVKNLRDETLPIYTILVPLYMESAPVMARLIHNLTALDYPPEKLDIKLICEADDTNTLNALKALRPRATMEIIRVPPSKPRTKPKACNIALQHIRGEFLVIFDAEDAPARDQLKRAIALFSQGTDKLACVQSPLNYYNRDENLLTQLFAIEYSALFRLHLPALERMGIPIPLGGTSNHLRVAALHAVGGWDAFNVTEDADLGIRLSYFGYHTRVLPSLTLEEAPITLGAWMKQRTRWIKGYIQTWLVYMRDPRELRRRLGPTGYYGFQFFVGAPALTFLLAPFFWIICVTSPAGSTPAQFPHWLQILCAISFLGGVFSNWLTARAVLDLEGWHHLRRAMLIFPLYWLLHSVAAARAVWQLAFNPHYWGKTKHGMSRMRAAKI